MGTRCDRVRAGRQTGSLRQRWEALWSEYGPLGREESFAPAIRAAEEGFDLSPRIARFVEIAFDSFPDHAKAIYGRNGTPLAAGERLVQKDLGRTLRAFAADGPGVIHGGEIGRAIDRAMRESGSFLRLEDLEENEAEWYAPISIEYRGYTRC